VTIALESNISKLSIIFSKSSIIFISTKSTKYYSTLVHTLLTHRLDSRVHVMMFQTIPQVVRCVTLPVYAASLSVNILRLL